MFSEYGISLIREGEGYWLADFQCFAVTEMKCWNGILGVVQTFFFLQNFPKLSFAINLPLTIFIMKLGKRRYIN